MCCFDPCLGHSQMSILTGKSWHYSCVASKPFCTPMKNICFSRKERNKQIYTFSKENYCRTSKYPNPIHCSYLIYSIPNRLLRKLNFSGHTPPFVFYSCLVSQVYYVRIYPVRWASPHCYGSGMGLQGLSCDLNRRCRSASQKWVCPCRALPINGIGHKRLKVLLKNQYLVCWGLGVFFPTS